MAVVVVGHVLRSPLLRHEAIAERVFRRDGVPVHRVAVAGPVGEIGARFALGGSIRVHSLLKIRKGLPDVAFRLPGRLG